jgi:hypothetical protein
LTEKLASDPTEPFKATILNPIEEIDALAIIPDDESCAAVI